MQTIKILATDDEFGMRQAIERSLSTFQLSLPEIGETLSFEVKSAESGEQALEIVRQSPPDILLLDYKMQGISGLEVLERLREFENQDVLTIMVTAYASLETAVSAIKIGAFDFLAKPFTPQELKDTVSKAAENLIMARHARRLEQEKRQVRFQFITVLAHELKAPLNAIEGYINIMREQPEALKNRDTYKNVMERCTIRIEQMRKLIFDLLETTSIESGLKKRDFEEVDLTLVSRLALETANTEAEKHNIAMELDAPGSLLLTADRSEIEIIMNNLISNAVKYNRDNGCVKVKMEGTDSQVIISVSDTGIGMTEEEKTRLFEEFVRIKNEKTRNILGSGLGLSIVKKLAMLYGGNVEVESRPDEGSTFRVTLNRQGSRESESDGS